MFCFMGEGLHRDLLGCPRITRALPSPLFPQQYIFLVIEVKRGICLAREVVREIKGTFFLSISQYEELDN